MKIKLYSFVYLIALLVIITSCNKHSDYSTGAEVLREWKFQLSSSNENHVNSGPAITASFHLEVLSDNSLRYDINVDSTDDKILGAEIDLGNPVSDGPLLVNLSARIANSYVSGVLTGVSQSVIDTLLNNSIEKYVNVISSRAPTGLVRGQLNSTVVLSQNVQLTGGEVVPSVTTTTSGTAYIRLTSDKVLYSNVTIDNPDATDPITTVTINNGASGANGSALLNLVSNTAEINVPKTNVISAADYATLLNNRLYVTAGSASYPNGKLRGQIR